MAKTPAEKRTSQDPAALILREEAWPFVRGKRSHGSDIPPLRKLFSSLYINIGSTIVSHVFGREIEVDRGAADKTELEFGQFMAIIHTGWCCSGKL
ncbi:hypothetical protein EPH95_00555 [Salicibibacter halophilus]|uniref:Uncharacterized protein n=1 Tax=Salicibibacter halophilus TaxID=2502791 RepID=A0A514LDD8_9BACI|nr:hypothetical protein [Salicibibacter halophilus]QDI89847.1 hypothetical protein EPH95_00555 [Salicibibacter halophilus]